MVSCKACGKEIAKGVKKCVNCGKDQRSFFMQHKVLTVLMIIALVAGISVITEGNNGISKNKPVVTVTSAKLSKEYEENEVKADKQYKNKLASISGEVYDIGVIAGETFIVLSADKDFAVTQVQLPRE